MWGKRNLNMAKYLCKNCNYSFQAENAGECKFCGMDSIELEKSAGELLDDVDRLLRG